MYIRKTLISLLGIITALSCSLHSYCQDSRSEEKNKVNSLGSATREKDWREKKRELRQKLKEDKKEERMLERKLLMQERERELSEGGGNKGGEKKITYPPTVKKTRYRIDMLASIYLDELVKGRKVIYKNKIPEKAIAGLSFYEGVMIAIDSLKKENYNVDIFIHDIASKNETAESLITTHALDSSDLIIGAVMPQELPKLASYALQRKINFVSALSPIDEDIHSNKYFTILQATLKSHCEWIKRKLAKERKGKKTFLIYRNNIKADENAFKYLTTNVKQRADWIPVQCNSLPTKQLLSKKFDTSKNVTVVVAILDNNYADSILKILNREFPKTHFEIIGMPQWTGLALQNRSKNYANLSISISGSFNFSSMLPTIKYVDKKFGKMFGGKPQELVYRGFESMIWYGHLLQKYGTIFNYKYSDISNAPFTKFNIQHRWDKNGGYLYNENLNIFFTRFDKGTVAIEGN